MAYTPPLGNAVNFDLALGAGSGVVLPALVLDDAGAIRQATTTDLVLATRFVATIGDGVNTVFTVTHNLGTTAVIVMIFKIVLGTYTLENDHTVVTDTNDIVITFASAPGVSEYQVVVFG